MADLSKQKALDVDPKAIQQIIFTGKTDNTIRVYYVLEQSKETLLELAKGASVATTYKWLNIVRQMLNYQILNWKN